MESRWFLYAGMFLLGYFLLRFILTNRYIARKINANMQEVIANEEYKVKGRFE